MQTAIRKRRKLCLPTVCDYVSPHHLCTGASKECTGCGATARLKRLHAQVYRQCQRGYWRASKRWCKALPPEGVNKALLRFANNEAGLRPVDIYGGARGAIAQLRELEAWFQARARPRRAHFQCTWAS